LYVHIYALSDYLIILNLTRGSHRTVHSNLIFPVTYIYTLSKPSASASKNPVRAIAAINTPIVLLRAEQTLSTVVKTIFIIFVLKNCDLVDRSSHA